MCCNKCHFYGVLVFTFDKDEPALLHKCERHADLPETRGSILLWILRNDSTARDGG